MQQSYSNRLQVQAKSKLESSLGMDLHGLSTDANSQLANPYHEINA